MAWFEDLSVWTYMGIPLQQLKAVGWLSKGRPYSTGEVSEEFYRSLSRLLLKPWGLWVSMGFHDCEFCRFTGGVKSSRELIVPGDRCLYITPENVSHYIDAHGYCPPAEFQEAVLRCPHIESPAYKTAFLKNGGRELMQRIKAIKPIG